MLRRVYIVGIGAAVLAALWYANRQAASGLVEEVLAKLSKGAKYKPLFDAAESRYAIPGGLLYRMAYQESRFREEIITGKVRSSAGAVGIMQIVPRFHPSIDAGDAAADERAALDPARAIDYAGKYLRQLHAQLGSWELALAGYNAGPGNVRKYNGIPPFEETRNYVAQITADVNLKGLPS